MSVSSSSLLVLSDSSKRIVQILQLLDERRLSLSLSVSRKNLIVVAGLGLLWQNAETKSDSKIAQESQKLVNNVIDLLRRESAAVAGEFSMLDSSLVSRDGLEEALKNSNSRSFLPTAPDMLSPAPPQGAFKVSSKMQQQQRQSRKGPMAINIGPSLGAKNESLARRATVSGGSPLCAPRPLNSSGRASFDVAHPGNYSTPILAPSSSSLSEPRRSNSHSPAHHSEPDVHLQPATGSLTTADWEYVVSDMDRGFSNIFTGIYGGKDCGEDTGPFATITAEYGQKSPQNVNQSIPTEQLGLSGMTTTGSWTTATTTTTDGTQGPTDAEGVFNNYSTGEGLASAGDGAGSFGTTMDPFRGMMMTAADETLDGFGLGNGWKRLAV